MLSDMPVHTQRLRVLEVFYGLIQPCFPNLHVFVNKNIRVNHAAVQKLRTAGTVTGTVSSTDATTFFFKGRNTSHIKVCVATPATKCPELRVFLYRSSAVANADTDTDSSPWCPFSMNDITDTEDMIGFVAVLVSTVLADVVPVHAFSAIPLAAAAFSAPLSSLETVSTSPVLSPDCVLPGTLKEALACSDVNVTKAYIRILLNDLNIQKARCDRLATQLHRLRLKCKI
jgi:hypothetical protein